VIEIGFVTDYIGKAILEPRAPVSGVILRNTVPSLKKGDNIADIGIIVVHAPNTNQIFGQKQSMILVHKYIACVHRRPSPVGELR